MTTERAPIRETLADPYECPHDVTILCVRTFRNKSCHYVRQCVACAQPAGNSIPREQARREAAGRELPLFDEAARERAYELRDEARREREATRREKWWRLYEEYLASERWAALRQRVLDRCRGLCEGCRQREATIVHHLTYEHLYDELLYELVGLCRPCHDRAHHRDEENDEDGAL